MAKPIKHHRAHIHPWAVRLLVIFVVLLAVVLVQRNRDSTSRAQTDSSPSATLSPLSRRVFVTSGKYTGDLGGLARADAECQNKADAAKLGGTWKAWLSDSNTSASLRLNHSDYPYVRIDNVIVANNWADLTDGQLKNTIQVDESGKFVAAKGLKPQGAWTGTNTSGDIKTPNCANWTSRSTKIEGIGGSISHVFAWTDAWLTGGDPSFGKCSNSNHLYCFEQ